MADAVLLNIVLYLPLLGTAALLRAPDAEAARAILTPNCYADIEVHNWQFGGRDS